MLLLAYRTLKKEFSKKYRCLSIEDAAIFQQCQWQVGVGRRWWYIGYRWLMCIFLLYGLSYDWFLDNLGEEKCKGGPLECRFKWLVYCTNWAYSVLTIQSLMAAYLATSKPLPSGSKPTAFHKVYWIMNNIANGLSLSVSLVYWTMVHTPERIVDFSNLKGHVTNVFVVVLDLLMVAHPVRLLHAYQPMAMGFAFFTFSAIFFCFGGTNRQLEEAIYPAFDWRRPLRACMMAAGSEISVVLMYTCVWCIFLARRKVAALVRRQKCEEREDFV